MDKENFTLQQLKAVEFIRMNTGRIEIFVNAELQRVYFPIRPECEQLSVGLRT